MGNIIILFYPGWASYKTQIIVKTNDDIYNDIYYISNYTCNDI